MQVVMGHAVQQVQVLKVADQETAERIQACFLPPTIQNMSPEKLRRSKIRIWLLKNQVPVEEEGDKLRVAGILTISSPYKLEDCCSSNQIVLDRIQKLIQKLVLEETHLDSDSGLTL